MVAHASPKYWVTVAVTRRETPNVADIVEKDGSGRSLVVDGDDPCDSITSALDSIAVPRYQSDVVLVQLQNGSLTLGRPESFALVQMIKKHARCWAVLLVGDRGVYGADSDREISYWALPARDTSDLDWSAFFTAAAENYLQTRDLSEAVAQALAHMGI